MFSGYRWEMVTELLSVRNRDLQPLLGRWLTRDDLGYIDGLNLYQYASARVIVARDTFGRATAVSTTAPCGECASDRCFWENKIESAGDNIVVSFVKDIIDPDGKSVKDSKCHVDRSFASMGGKGPEQLVFIVTFDDGTSTGNIAKNPAEWKKVAKIEGNLTTPKPGERPTLTLSKEQGKRKIKTILFQERLLLTCQDQRIYWCFRLIWKDGETNGWEKVVDIKTDCFTIFPKLDGDAKPDDDSEK